MRDIEPARKVAIMIEAAKFTDVRSGRLFHGAIKHIIELFRPVSARTVKRIVKEYRDQRANGVVVPTFENKRRGRCGRHSKLTPELRVEYTRIAQEYANMWIRLSDRYLQIELQEAGYPLSRKCIQSHLKILKARKINLSIKPKLTPVHKEDRMRYVLDMADRNHGLNRPEHYWKNQLDIVHVDESWFYLNRVTNQIVVFEGVNIPEAPTVQHKSHIPKVMFLVAMARPFIKPDGTWFDGKVGCWDITERVPAQRNSVNRPRGTLITTPLSLTADIYYDLFTKDGGVIDAIKTKMPWMQGRLLKVQQDGAKPHIGHDNINRISTFANVNGWNIRLFNQPAQSPDLNIMDLGLFHSLKCRVAHIKRVAHNVDELIDKVLEAYDEYDAETLDHIWAHLLACWNCILRENGGNQYKAPHTKARTRGENGQSCVDLTIEVDEYNRVFDMLNN